MADLLDHVADLAHPARRQQARAALAAAGPARLVALREGLSHPWWRIRSWSCRLLDEEPLDGLTVARLVATARGDPHKKVRRQALQALVFESCIPAGTSPERPGWPYDAVGLLLERLRNDRSVSVRRAAATGLMYHVTLDGNRQRRVQRGLRRAVANDHDEAIRRRAQQALSALAAVEQIDTYAALRWAMAERRVELALRLARGHMRRWEAQGNFVEARAWLEQVLAASDGAPPSLRAPVLHDAGFAALVTGDLEAATSHLRASVAQWDRAGEGAARTRTKSLLAFLASFGDDPSVIDDLEDEVAELRSTGDDSALVDVLAGCGQARMFRGTPQLARRHFQEALALARQPGLEAKLVSAVVGLAAVELAQGDYAEAEVHLVEALDRAEAAGDEHTGVIGRCWLAELHRLRGDSAGAAARAGECLERARAMGAPYPLAMALLAQARAVLEEGDLHAARSLFQKASTVATTARLSHLVTAARIGRGEVALARGDAATARRLFELAHRRAQQRGNEVATAHCSYHLARLAQARGHLRRAASLHDQALALRDRAGQRAAVADSLEALAGLAVTTGNNDKAARLFGAAHALRAAVGCARSRLATATYEADVGLLAARMESDDFESAWANGAALPQGEAVWHAHRGRGPRRRPDWGWDALTPAQRRVADLVAQGLTNAEVAERLCLGPETVKSHVAKVLSKLEMSSRWELRGASPAQR